MITHDHGLSPQDDVTIRRNWERVQVIIDLLLETFRDSRDGSCAPWCVPACMEDFLLATSQHELVAVTHALLARIVDKEDLDQGYNPPGAPGFTSFNNKV